MTSNLINNDRRQLLNDYVLTEQIGSGSFGEVYLARYKTGGYVAVKVEERKKSNRIYNEYKIYVYLHRHGFDIGLPKIYDYLQTPDYNIMVMQLMGPSLDDIFNKHKKKFKLSTVLLLALQIITLMEQLHGAEYIHRDIKPNNFLIGRNQNKHQVYIMDFGLSKKYVIDDKHIKYRDGRSLIGTARYASVNMHMGIEPARRDEMESIGYMFVYFLKGILPWQGIKKQKGYNHIQKIGEMKMSTKLDRLCEGLPDCFKEYISYCKKLKFDEEPDYDYMRGLFKDTAKKMDIKPEFEWLDNHH